MFFSSSSSVPLYFFFSLSVWVTYTDDYDPKIERVNREVFLMIVIWWVTSPWWQGQGCVLIDSLAPISPVGTKDRIVTGMLLEETETSQWICWESNRCHIFIFMLKNYFHIRPCTYTTPIQVFWNFNDSLRGRVCVQTLVHFFFSFCLFLFVFVGWLAALHVCCYVNLVFKTI